MNDDIWEALASTPARTEPVANRDNSLAGFQRRLLQECGYKLEQATEALADLTERIEELRARYESLHGRAADAHHLIADTAKTLRRLQETTNIGGLAPTIVALEEYLDG
jgi:chromosome segregation ATPase